MKHPDWPAFLAAICAEPDEDTPRLVAADFLEENGEPARAAFIRIQIALANLETLELSRSPEADELREQTQIEVDELRKKERAFLGPLSDYPLLWGAEECPELVRMAPSGRSRTSLGLPSVEGAGRLHWHRGFVERVDCPAVEWLRHGVAVRRRNPVREVVLQTCYSPTRNEWYAGLNSLRGLRAVWLDLFPAQSGDGEFVRWLREWLPDTQVAASPL
jgi:uncharacterized protein (TIGR02996 family)